MSKKNKYNWVIWVFFVGLAYFVFYAFIEFRNPRPEYASKTEGKTSDSQPTAGSQPSDQEQVEKVFDEFKSLYNDLLKFKDKPDFKTYGFGQGGPYNSWLKEVEALKNHPDSKLLLKKGVVAGELEQLGLAYATSKGAETEVTKTFNKLFLEAINAKPTEIVETKSGNAHYQKLKTEYELFGKWQIWLNKDSYPYEIYRNGDEYVGVIPVDNFRTQILEKKGQLYYVKGDKYGEYYRIDASLNMTLYDKDGDLSSVGYRAIKVVE